MESRGGLRIERDQLLLRDDPSTNPRLSSSSPSFPIDSNPMPCGYPKVKQEEDEEENGMHPAIGKLGTKSFGRPHPERLAC